MKYKVKYATHYINKPFPSDYFGADVTIESEDKGVFVFIPFTDTRFFEPVKTRKFEVEVSEEEISNFEYRMNYEGWKVTELF